MLCGALFLSKLYFLANNLNTEKQLGYGVWRKVLKLLQIRLPVNAYGILASPWYNGLSCRSRGISLRMRLGMRLGVHWRMRLGLSFGFFAIFL